MGHFDPLIFKCSFWTHDFLLQNFSPQVVASEKGKKPPLFIKNFLSSSSSQRERLFYTPFDGKFLIFQIPLSSSQREGAKRAIKSKKFQKLWKKLLPSLNRIKNRQIIGLQAKKFNVFLCNLILQHEGFTFWTLQKFFDKKEKAISHICVNYTKMLKWLWK